VNPSGMCEPYCFAPLFIGILMLMLYAVVRLMCWCTVLFCTLGHFTFWISP